jgi:hypothetical protein
MLASWTLSFCFAFSIFGIHYVSGIRSTVIWGDCLSLYWHHFYILTLVAKIGVEPGTPLVIFALGSQNNLSVGPFKWNRCLVTCYFGAEGSGPLQSVILTIASFDYLLHWHGSRKIYFCFNETSSNNRKGQTARELVWFTFIGINIYSCPKFVPWVGMPSWYGWEFLRLPSVLAHFRNSFFIESHKLFPIRL